MPERLEGDADEWLVQQAQRGDTSAFETLFLKYFEPICIFVLRYVKDQEDAKDLALQTFMKAHTKLSTLTRGASFRPWLYRIASNTARDHLRARKRTLDCTSVGLEESWVETFETQIHEELVLAQVKAAVMAKLADVQKKCFALQLQGADVAEIARTLGLTTGTVRTYLCKIKIIFRAEYLRLRKIWDEE